ncbi:MAG: putative bifunctional diguanylate cyclase/phosphodiesterase [Alphaproteobacteria bacterium]
MGPQTAHTAERAERDRLAELERLKIPFDTPIAELQAICDLTVRLLEVPVALVSIVSEDEQRFAAQVGLDGTSRTPREHSFCTHCIMSSEPLIVENALEDHRFRNLPLVTGEPNIRAYMGTPLETDPGLRVGTLCAIDMEPRRFHTHQRADLIRLGRIAIEILKSHKAKQRLTEELNTLERRANALSFLAQRDGLTGLLNASTFRTRVAERMQNLPAGTRGSLILFDVDNLRSINGRYGHRFGDTYLTALSEVLGTIQDEDALVGRLGGDQFAVYVSADRAQTNSVEGMIRRLRAGFAETANRLNKQELGRASIGIAYTPDHASSLEELNHLADVALYASKENGRNQTTVFSNTLCSTHNMPSFRTQILTAIQRDEFVPYYQPQVSLEDGTLVGFEVLCRWHHPTRGVVLPKDYQAAFRDRAVSPQLTRALFLQATQDLAAWRVCSSNPLRIAMNVTAYDLTDSHFVSDMEQILVDRGLGWQSITIEVTETVVMGEEDDQVFASLKDLRERGARIALDDFGTGYGGLKHLRSWPVDSIKIDQSFVRNITDEGDDYHLVKAVIDLARSFNMLVVAEGVETTEQRDVLRGLRCHYGQGFLFGHATAGADIPASLKAA